MPQAPGNNLSDISAKFQFKKIDGKKLYIKKNIFYWNIDSRIPKEQVRENNTMNIYKLLNKVHLS